MKKNELKSFLQKQFPSFYADLAYYRAKYHFMLSPRKEAERRYLKSFRDKPDWNNPQNLIEKVFWMELYSDTSLWTLCADKYAMRDFVKKRGCDEALNEIYGKWDDVNEIDYSTLPDQFVLKCNHDCGSSIIVNDKSKLNIKATNKFLHKRLNRIFGYEGSQIHYMKIKRCIIAEKLLPNDFVDISPDSLIDFKIWCFNGEPESVLVVADRNKDKHHFFLYDLNWNRLSSKYIKTNTPNFSEKTIPRPKSLEKMIEMAKSISKGFPQVRVDFYEVKGKPIIGEMTFSTGFGYFTDEYYEYLGSKVDLGLVQNKNN